MVAAGGDPAARRAYGAALAVTVVLAAAGELLLERLPAGQGTVEAVREFGYTFTALCLLGGYLQSRRSRRVAAQAAGLDPRDLERLVWKETLRAALFCSAGILLGSAYWGLGGRSVERHARTFIALGPPAFLALAVRPSRWGSSPA